MRFDWYAATVPVEPTVLVSALREGLAVDTARPGAGRHGYAQRLDLVGSSGELAATIYLPDPKRPAHPHAYASGEVTEEFVGLLRGMFPEHRVTRFDSCYDVEDRGAFDRIIRVALDLADRLNLKVQHVGDWHRAIDGRTLYIGSPTSSVRLRIYEKGIQLRAGLTGSTRDAISPDWVRVELQVRPQKDAKAAAAACTPEDAWGYSGWSQELAGSLQGLQMPRVQQVRWRQSNDERAYRFMVKQFGPTLRRLAAAQGWEGMLRTLRDDVEEDGRRRSRA